MSYNIFYKELFLLHNQIAYIGSNDIFSDHAQYLVVIS
jgi:hypothetical protein